MRPETSIDALLYRIFDFEIRLSPPARPVYRGAVFILGMGLGLRGKVLVIAMLAALTYLLGPLHGPLLLLELILLAMAAGALAGVVYGLLSPLANAGDFGVWFRWALAIYGYVLILAASIRNGPFSIRDPSLHLIAWVFAALGALGMVLTDDRGASRLSPRQFRLLQNRVLLRAAPRRMWLAMRRKRQKHEIRRLALEAEAVRRPEATAALVTMLTDLRTDLLLVRRGLARAKAPEIEPQERAELEGWIAEVEGQLEAARAPR